MENKINELNKESKIVLFLRESKDKNKEEIKRLYLSKYNLSEKSKDINIRVIERFLGVYSKYSKEKKEEKIKVVKEELKGVNINYGELIERYKEIKEKIKRSNRLNLIDNLKIKF